MEVLEKLRGFDSQIQKAESHVRDLNNKRINWCRENSRDIKSLYPKKGVVYQIKAMPIGYKYTDLTDEIYYFKAENIRFNPSQQYYWNNEKIYPTVKGVILDANLSPIQIYDPEICITNLKEVKENNKPLNFIDRITNVYVMIDKNTGFYKIGRSKNPEQREKTLQSEKPTIEMLFNHDARVKDEKHLHDLFKDKRVRGEWFDLSGSDLTTIREYFNHPQDQLNA